MRLDAVAATADAATISSLGQRFQAALEASLRPGGSILPCIAFARQIPAAQQAKARGIDLGNGLSLWHAPWTAREHSRRRAAKARERTVREEAIA